MLRPRADIHFLSSLVFLNRNFGFCTVFAETPPLSLHPESIWLPFHLHIFFSQSSHTGTLNNYLLTRVTEELYIHASVLNICAADMHEDIDTYGLCFLTKLELWLMHECIYVT